MTKLSAIALLPALLGSLFAADDKKPEPRFEMRYYVMGVLKRGPNWTAEQTPETQKIQESHMAHIYKMAASGKLVVAGPMAGDKEIAGIYIFDATSVDEVKAMAEADPLLQSGRLVLELRKWYAATGLRVDGAKK